MGRRRRGGGGGAAAPPGGGLSGDKPIGTTSVERTASPEPNEDPTGGREQAGTAGGRRPLSTLTLSGQGQVAGLPWIGFLDRVRRFDSCRGHREKRLFRAHFLLRGGGAWLLHHCPNPAPTPPDLTARPCEDGRGARRAPPGKAGRVGMRTHHPRNEGPHIPRRCGEELHPPMCSAGDRPHTLHQGRPRSAQAPHTSAGPVTFAPQNLQW